MFLMVFAGNEQAAPRLLEAFAAAGFPARLAPDCGFEPELLTSFVEVLGTAELVDDATRIASAEGWSLRLHSPVEAQVEGVL